MLLLHMGLRLLLTVALGAVVGVERQWRQRMAGLRTNTLVAIGACLFVMVADLTPQGNPIKIAAAVVAGIGFLGAGVIMRQGLSISGLNTAATLWCAAAIGVLGGAGYGGAAVMGTAAVLFANLLLRPIAQRINRLPDDASERPVHYRVRIVCLSEQESHVRSLLLYAVKASGLNLQALHSEDTINPERVEVRAELASLGQRDREVEQAVTRLSLEPGVSTVRWEIAPEGGSEIDLAAVGSDLP
jgi:putative Mg2+ transporter-C (MgtC) family protein